MEKEKTRYNDDELQEFKDIILKKMEIAKTNSKPSKPTLKTLKVVAKAQTTITSP